MPYVPSRVAVQRLGVCAATLRRYADRGQIETIRNVGGQRLYDVDSYCSRQRYDLEIVLYCRVLSIEHIQDLDLQVEHLRKQYPTAEVIKDIGSGLNYKRPGLRNILERCLQARRLQIVVSHRDKLCRFGFDMVKFIVEKSGGEIIVLQQGGKRQFFEEELFDDLVCVLQAFSCRIPSWKKENEKEKKRNSIGSVVTGLICSLRTHLRVLRDRS